MLAAIHKFEEMMKVTKNKTIHILIPIAGFVMGCLYVSLYAFINYCDTAPLYEPLYETIFKILSYNDVRLAICFLGFIGFTIGCITNLLIALLQKHIKLKKSNRAANKRINLP